MEKGDGSREKREKEEVRLVLPKRRGLKTIDISADAHLVAEIDELDLNRNLVMHAIGEKRFGGLKPSIISDDSQRIYYPITTNLGKNKKNLPSGYRETAPLFMVALLGNFGSRHMKI